MLDRFGNKIQVGWSENEILWLEAANTLPADERTAALHDIANMTCRGYYNVRDRAGLLQRMARQVAAAARAEADLRVILVPAPPVRPFRAPTKQQLMAGRAR